MTCCPSEPPQDAVDIPPPDVRARLDALGALLAGAPHNLLSAGDRAHVLDRHLLPSWIVAGELACTPAARWLDLGTGGGLPGLVCALRYPGTSFVLLDATAKKVHAVAQFARALGLRNVQARAGRAEDLAHERGLRGAFDGVVSRAVARLVVLQELARGFLRPEAPLVAVKGPAVEAELREAAAGRKMLRYGEPEVRWRTSGERAIVLVTMRARGAPPRGFPRAPGRPRTDPLGALRR